MEENTATAVSPDDFSSLFADHCVSSHRCVREISRTRRARRDEGRPGVRRRRRGGYVKNSEDDNVCADDTLTLSNGYMTQCSMIPATAPAVMCTATELVGRLS